jgi:hypothetical protein
MEWGCLDGLLQEKRCGVCKISWHDGIHGSFRRFAQKVQETEPTELKPVFVDAGVTYMYLQVLELRLPLLRALREGKALYMFILCLSLLYAA